MEGKNMGIVTGRNATIKIASGSTFTGQSLWGISDFSLTFSRGTVEQELVGQPGNYRAYGALSCEGSFTNCKFAASGNFDALSSIIDGCTLKVSGNVGSTRDACMSWYLVSCQVTGYDVSIGDADTITEASIDFTTLCPYNITIEKTTGKITDAGA